MTRRQKSESGEKNIVEQRERKERERKEREREERESKRERKK